MPEQEPTIENALETNAEGVSTPEGAVGTAMSALEKEAGGDEFILSESLKDFVEWVKSGSDVLKSKIGTGKDAGKALVEQFKREHPEATENLVLGGKVIGKTAKVGWNVGRIGLYVAFKMLWPLLKFAGLALSKKGKVGWKDGWKLGGQMFDYKAKKDNK
ncbi:MAG: hypothetical protein WC711_03295 [Candidatus Staskawiczbacteria bacterium]|jgi:hypothetical protein